MHTIYMCEVVYLLKDHFSHTIYMRHYQAVYLFKDHFSHTIYICQAVDLFKDYTHLELEWIRQSFQFKLFHTIVTLIQARSS